MSRANSTAARASSAAPWGAMAILFLAHFVVDSQVSFLSPLLPLIREKFHLSLGAAGVLVYLLALSNAASQPLTAILVDRWPRLPWLAVGLIGSAFCLTAVGWLPAYAAVAAVVPMGGVLAGLAHPDMASRAGGLSEAHRSLAVSVFVSGGRLGFALGPLVAIFVAKWWGMEWLWFYVIVNVVAVIGIMRGLPRPAPAASAGGGSTVLRGLGQAVWRARLPILTLLVVTICRAAVTINLQGFLPTVYVERGMGLWQGGIANSVLLFFGMVGVMVGGALSDRFGKRKIISIGIVLAFVGLVGFLSAPPWMGIFLVAILGSGLYMPMGVSMAFAQEFLPSHRGFASALTLGFSWGMASFSVLPISMVAERIGLFQAFWVLPLFLLLALLLAFRLPGDRPQR